MSSAQSSYSINGNSLTFSKSGASVDFQWPIGDVIEFDGIFVVRLEPDPGACFNENVFGVTPDGKIVWTIQRRKHVYDDSPYTAVRKVDSSLKVFNWDGDELLIEPHTGSVIDEGYGR